MIFTVKNEVPFQILSSSFSIGPSPTGYELQVGADSKTFSTLFSVGANTPRMVTNVANGSYFRLKNNVGDVKVNWQRVCVTEGGEGGSGTELQPVADFPLNAVEGTVISYTGSSSASGVYQYDGTEWTEVGGSIDPSVLDGYATSGDMQSAFTLISETQQVAAAGLNQLEGRIDELSGSSVDLSAYWTSAQTEDAISAATAGKADAANVTANTTMRFPLWNEQGVVTGTTGGPIYKATISYNGQALGGWIKDGNVGVGPFYAPTTPGTAGQILVSAGIGAPVWSAVTFPDVSNYVTSAQVETQIEAKNYVNSGDVKSQVEAYNYATVSQIPTVPTSNTAFTNDAGYITDAAIENLVTSAQVETQITSKGYATVSQIPTVPTSNTAFTNDAGYITSAAIADMVTSTYISTIWRGTQADYDDIPTKDPNTFYIIL